uniref:Putative oxidative stress regulator AosR n=1 Tax=Mycobacterium leprae (strain TN) TaxID=272631 RepID=AOSR_MYCLE|nr:RecName: Full=Putative oxidative stress regulator AosR [Mycobacterium leprae TN]
MPPVCGRRCSRTGEVRRYPGSFVRKWKRVETANGPRFRSVVAPHEVALLKHLVGALLGLLNERESSSPLDELEVITGIKAGNAQRPEDPTLRRLLPDFYTPDDKDQLDPAALDAVDSLNAALRSLHEPEIVDAKRSAAQQLLDTLPESDGRLELTEASANAWIAAVNDLRLALGVILEIDRPAPERVPAGHPLSVHFDVYQWLTVLQEYLVLALMAT